MVNLLSWLFPPRLPGTVRDWEPPADPVAEQGKVLRVYHKLTGIERHFAEVDAERAKPRYFGTNSQYMKQLRNAENQMQQHARDLVAAGYVNTIHDEWELVRAETAAKIEQEYQAEIHRRGYPGSPLLWTDDQCKAFAASRRGEALDKK